MCDTLVVLPEYKKTGITIFAKNSDREPNEPNIPTRVGRAEHKKGTVLRCTYITIDQVPLTYDIFMIKPSWMWGAEMGVNEHAVALGNEALFTRSRPGPPALTGMDLVRLALERSCTSREAVEVIVSLLERYGQGGNCGYSRKLRYDNSFLIADPSSAWLLETVGKYWATKRVNGCMAISNALILHDDYDECSANFWRKRNGELSDFKKTWEHALITRIARGEARRRFSAHFLKNHEEPLTAHQVMKFLRWHAPRDAEQLFRHRTYQSLCMHAGGPFSFQTTGSLVAEMDQSGARAWYTGSSLPCISLFKPFHFTTVSPAQQEKPGPLAQAAAFWMKREHFHRLILGKCFDNLDWFLAERDALEGELLKRSRVLQTVRQKEELLNYAFNQEQKMIGRAVAESESRPFSPQGGPMYRYYWAKQNRLLSRQPSTSGGK
ncbi:MAG TPA: C69 family dipeptidase [Atribacteraceae bacterium]|nr:C69 family dipeptidase [Atribacteraceae bacterium]